MEISGIELNPLASPPHLVLLAIALGGICGVLAWRSAARMPWMPRVTAVSCRTLAVMLLVVPLLNPGHWESQRVLEEASTVILVDTSASMQVADVDGNSRAVAALAIAKEIDAAAASAGRTVRAMTFDTNARRAELAQLEPSAFDGDGTDVALALSRVADVFGTAAGRVSEVVLISDGRDIGGNDAIRAARNLVGLNARLHTITLGDEVHGVDARVAASRPQVTAFSGRPVAVRANVTYQGTDPARTKLSVVSDALDEPQQEVLDLQSGESRAVRFSLPALPAGLHEVELVLDPVAGEEELANNRAAFVVRVHEEPIRVLLIEGSPYWDTKFIAQLLQQDPNYRFELVYRLSDERFFGLDDGSIMADSGASPGVVRTVFPASAAELAQIDLIVLGRATDEFLNDSHVANLREWMAAGGALVLARGNPVSAEWPGLDALMPMEWDVDWDGGFQWRPTMLGEDAGLFGDDLPGKDDPIWTRLPGFQRAAFGSRLRPFTQVLVEGVATGAERERKFPLVVSRRFGAGLITAINVNDFWRWDFIPESEEARGIYRGFWSRLFEWSLAYSEFLPGANFAIRLGHSEIDPGRPVRARVMRRAGAEPDADPILRVRGESGDRIEMELSPVEGESDLWETLVNFADPGEVRIEVVSRPEPDRSLAMATLKVRSPPSERDNPSADPEFMRDLAKAGNGFAESAGSGADWFDEAPPVPGGEGDLKWKEAWTNPWLALVMVACFAGEWFTRRRYNLA